MRIHGDWTTGGLALPAAAPDTSIFPGRAYLELWWRHFGDGELHLVEDDSALLPLWHRPDGTISLVGDEDLTDYHSPLGEGAGALLVQYLKSRPPGTRYRLDSLPAEAAGELASATEAAGAVPHEA
ncbi:MAG: hypothetical protein ACR2OI_08490, partial [Acidimicrobiia bacterium]